MELLPELFCLIGDYANISSIRIFCRTNTRFYELGKEYIKEKFSTRDPHIFGGYFRHRCYQHQCVEKFTIELALDGFEVPKSYYIQKNAVICSVFAYIGRLDLLKEAVSKGRKIQHDTPIHAAYFGHNDVIEYCCSYVIFTDDMCDKMTAAAAFNNRLDTLMFLDEKNLLCMRTTLDSSIAGGHLHLLQWIDQPDKINWGSVVRYEHQHIIEWGIAKEYVKLDELQVLAIIHDKVRLLKWIIDQGYSITDKHYDIAVIHYAKDVIESVLTNSVLIQQLTAKYDRIDILERQVILGHKIDESIFAIAMREKSEFVIWWMIENDILAKQIRINDHFPRDRKTARMLLERDLLYLDNSTCEKLVSLGYLDYIGSKIDTIPKSSYHFCIQNDTITKMIYGTKENNEQKLFCLSEDGQVKISELSKCRCWWYLLACTSIHTSDKYVEKIKECGLHG